MPRPKAHDATGPPPVAENLPAPPARSRWTFLSDAGKKAAFAVPAAWTLTARQALAATGLSCSAYGAACEVNEDCCDLNCHQPTMTCKGPI